MLGYFQTFTADQKDLFDIHEFDVFRFSLCVGSQRIDIDLLEKYVKNLKRARLDALHVDNHQLR